MNYCCPNATRMRQYRYIMCKAEMKSGVDYTQLINANKTFCPFQYYCRISGKTENTDRAKECYALKCKGE